MGGEDIVGHTGLFHAGAGVTGFVRYQLKTFVGKVIPYAPDPTWNGTWPAGDCCTWLCTWIKHHIPGRAWEVHCNAPLQVPSGQPPVADDVPREIRFTPAPGQIAFIHFSFGGTGGTKCFHLTDQFCLTGGVGGDPDYWDHLYAGDPKLIVLDSLGIDLNCRIATDPDKYPHAEPEYIEIVNDALAEAGHIATQISQPGHYRNSNYYTSGLNLWTHNQGFGKACDVLPAVHHGGDPNGDPWTVYVIPYGTDCRFPADLVLVGLQMRLRLSGDPESIAMGVDDIPQAIRIAATFELWLDLRPRLRDGWQNIECPIGFANDDPCDVTTDPPRYIVVASDACSQVPLRVYWRGIQGPRPWSRGPFEYGGGSVGCCGFLRMLDGLVIPGEVNDTSDPDSPQRFEGDVVLGLNTAPGDLGCD